MKILKAIVRFLSSPWVNLAASLFLWLFGTFLIYELGDDFSPASAFVGGVVTVAFSIYDYALSVFFGKGRRENL